MLIKSTSIVNCYIWLTWKPFYLSLQPDALKWCKAWSTTWINEPKHVFLLPHTFKRLYLCIMHFTHAHPRMTFLPVYFRASQHMLNSCKLHDLLQIISGHVCLEQWYKPRIWWIFSKALIHISRWVQCQDILIWPHSVRLTLDEKLFTFAMSAIIIMCVHVRGTDI